MQDPERRAGGGPPAVPDEFWTAAALRQASADRHIGRLIRAYRTHPWHGPRPLSQECVAEWLGTTQPRLSRVENGSRTEQLDLLVHWARVLEVPQRYLWFALPGRQLPRTPAGGDDTGTVRRVRALVLGRAASAGSRASDPMGSGTRGATDVDLLRRRVARSWVAYQAARFTRALQMAPDNLATAQHAVALATGDQRRRALRWQAFAYHSAAAVLTKLGEVDLAWITAERGLVAAREAGSAVVAGSLVRSVAHCLMATERPTAAGVVVADGLRDLRNGRDRSPSHLSVYGTLLLTGSVVAARSDDRIESSKRLDEASEAALELGRDANHLWTAFGPSNVAVHRVSTLLGRGDHRGALAIASRVDPAALPVERQVRHLLDTAWAYVGEGQSEVALASVLRAEILSPEFVAGHFLARRIGRALLDRKGARSGSAVRDLALRLGLET